MLMDGIERTAMAETRLTRSELFHELARMHKQHSRQPGLNAVDKKAIHRNEPVVRWPNVPARAAGPAPTEIPIQA